MKDDLSGMVEIVTANLEILANTDNRLNMIIIGLAIWGAVLTISVVIMIVILVYRFYHLHKRTSRMMASKLGKEKPDQESQTTDDGTAERGGGTVRHPRRRRKVMEAPKPSETAEVFRPQIPVCLPVVGTSYSWSWPPRIYLLIQKVNQKLQYLLKYITRVVFDSFNS